MLRPTSPVARKDPAAQPDPLSTKPRSPGAGGSGSAVWNLHKPLSADHVCQLEDLPKHLRVVVEAVLAKERQQERQ